MDDDVLRVFQFWTGGAAALFYVVLEHAYHFGYTSWVFGGEVVVFARVVAKIEELDEGGF